MTPQDLKTYTLQEIDGWRETMTETRYVKAEDAGLAIQEAIAECAKYYRNKFNNLYYWEKKARELIGGGG